MPPKRSPNTNDKQTTISPNRLYFFPYSGSDALTSGKQDASALAFDIHGVELCIINALRRAISAGCETVAFPFDGNPITVSNDIATNGTQSTSSITSNDKLVTGIRVLENTSVLHNEMIAHRLSLVPICLTPNELTNFDERNYQCTIDVRNTTNDVIHVTTKDIRVTNMNGASLPPEKHEQLFPPCAITGDHILLLHLKPNVVCNGTGEVIRIKAVPSVGNGKKHTRWSPVSVCYFKNIVSMQPDKLHFFLETVNPSYPPEVTVFDGFSYLMSHIQSLRDAVAASLPGFAFELSPNIRQEGSEEPLDEGCIRDRILIIPGEDHTLGNLIQGLLYDKWIVVDQSRDISFIGYFKRHPLNDDISLRIQIVDPNASVETLFTNGLNHILDHLDKLAFEWINYSDLGNRNIARVNEFLTRRKVKWSKILTASK